MSLTELLLQAKAKKAEDFLFVVGSEPRMRSAAGWSSLRNSPGLVTEWNLLRQSLLTRQQQEELDNKGVIVGVTALDNVRLGFSFYQNDSNMKAIINLELDSQKNEIQLPPSLMESCQRMTGLILLSGPGEAGQTLALQRIAQKLSEEKSFLGVVFSSRPFAQVKEGKGNFIYHTGKFSTPEEKDSLMAGVDVVIFDGGQEDSFFPEVLALAEKGLFVVYSLKSPSVTNTLARCLSVLKSRYGEYGASRLAEMLSLVVGQYPVASLSGEKVFAHELLLMKPQVRSLVEQEEIKEIEKMMSQSIENAGILTLNQSLLQHLIRRRVDLKAAFAVSKDPDNLDLLLKKVGI